MNNKRKSSINGLDELESEKVANNMATVNSTLGNTLSSIGNIFEAASLDPKVVESGPFNAQYQGNADLSNYYNKMWNDAIDEQRAMKDQMYQEELANRKEDSVIADKVANQQREWNAVNRQLNKAAFNDAVMKNLADRARGLAKNNRAIGDMFIGLWGA